MTENQIEKTQKEQHPGIILTDRFVNRDPVSDIGNWFFLADADDILERLAEHFTLTAFDLDAFSASVTDHQQLLDDMPRFQTKLRDGLQIPKEGQDGTGN